MTDTVQQKIIDGVVEALQGITGLTGGVSHSRQEPFSKQETPAINVYALNDSPQQQTLDYLLWQLLLRVVIVVRGREPDTIANQFRQEVHSRIVALMAHDAFDTPGLVQYVFPSNVQFDMAGGGDGDMGAVSCDFIFQYRTAYDDLTVVG